jgi:hypothetical protein
VALAPHRRQNYPNNPPPTRATAISEGHNRPPALQKRSGEVGPLARCNPFPCTFGRGSLLPVQPLGGMTDAKAVFYRGARERVGVADRGQRQRECRRPANTSIPNLTLDR